MHGIVLFRAVVRKTGNAALFSSALGKTKLFLDGTVRQFMKWKRDLNTYLLLFKKIFR
jgi:hypothetical protein